MTESRVTMIKGGKVLRPGFGDAEHADVLIRDGEIVAIAPDLPVPDGAEIIDANRLLLHPGLVNGHTHGHGPYARGLTDNLTLELLLASGPWLNGGRTLEDKYLSTAIGAAEMVLKGCTACYDLFFEAPTVSPEGIRAAGEAYRDVGMRAVLAPMVADHPFFRSIPGLYEALPTALQAEVDKAGAPEGAYVLGRLEETIRSWPFDPAMIRPALGPTVPLVCTDAFMKAVAELAQRYGIAYQTHLSESKVQEITALKRYGCSLTQHLERLGVLGPAMSAAHAVWLADEDMMRLADHGVPVSLNPGSNLRLGAGIANMRRLLDHGVVVGIGTDSASCSDNQNMYEAMRLASYLSRVQDVDRGRWVSAREAALASTEGSARVLGFEHIGRLDPGYRADIVFIDLGAVHWLPFRNAVHQLVQAEDATAVRHVMIDGRWVVRDQRLLTLDLEALRRKVERAIQRIEEGGTAAHDLFRKFEPVVASFCPGLARTPHHVHRYAGACC